MNALKIFRAFLYLAFWFGVLWLLLGRVVTFVPGAEQSWFTFTGALLLAGLFIPRWPYRVAAIVLVAMCISAAVSGHRRGIEYRKQHVLPSRRESGKEARREEIGGTS